MSWWQRHTSKNGLAGFKKRKTYELFSKEERDLLKTYFDEDYDLGDRQYSIADELGVSVARITVWWSNRASFLRRKGVDIPKTPTRPYAKVGFQDALSCLSIRLVLICQKSQLQIRVSMSS